MIVSENSKPSPAEFRQLMQETDNLLNTEASEDPEYYKKRSGTKLEEDVFRVLCICAKDTPFDNSIQLVSGHSFPDIVANRYYGVEVKSTSKNQWTSIGSSILESTRVESVERIFLTFGKLADPVQFLSRPYEECLSGITVTHYPRYQIDMQLEKNATIFDKMGVSYDTLRQMEKPVVPVSEYYRSRLKEGESLWWVTDKDEEVVSPPVIRFWNTLAKVQQEELFIKGCILFPEVFYGNSYIKYNGVSKWLITKYSILHPNIRDAFSAGGRKQIKRENGNVNVPAALGRMEQYKMQIIQTISEIPEDELLEYWNVKCINENRLEQWCGLVSRYDANMIHTYGLLCDIFHVESEY